jgi:tetratricopeptide (TPR) repeat protein
MSMKLNFYKTALRKKAEKGFQGYPMATIAFYGPDDQRATKVAVGIVAAEHSDPEVTRWQSPHIDIRRNASVLEEIVKLVRRRQTKSVAMPEQILGCPHEEGIDYPAGESCPQCPFWAGRPRPILDEDSSEEPGPAMPDRRAMEKMLSTIGESRDAGTALERAQQIMWDAWDERDRKRSIALAREALDLSPDCADAYVLLAEETAASVAEAIELYEKGVRAGERALGEQVFSQDPGHFWGILETRPYMRARAGLANALRDAGRVQEAISHYEQLLRLNPNDNQGNRDVLAACLIDTDRIAEAAELLERYSEHEGYTANWCYTSALVAYRTYGSNSDSKKKLERALQRNPHVPPYLLGQKRLPRRMPSLYGPGSVDEAVLYADLYGDTWKRAPDALEWLSAELKRSGT